MIENTDKFESLLEQSFKKLKGFEGSIISGEIISIDNNQALIDVGLKSEGRVSIEELKFCDKEIPK